MGITRRASAPGDGSLGGLDKTPTFWVKERFTEPPGTADRAMPTRSQPARFDPDRVGAWKPKVHSTGSIDGRPGLSLHAGRERPALVSAGARPDAEPAPPEVRGLPFALNVSGEFGKGLQMAGPSR